MFINITKNRIKHTLHLILNCFSNHILAKQFMFKFIAGNIS